MRRCAIVADMTRTTCLLLSILLATTACSERHRAEPTAPPPTPALTVAAPDPSRAILAARRAQQIEHLHEYWVAGNFPVNLETADMLNIFRDGQGRLCAIANLIYQSGYHALLEQTVRDDNHVALRDIHDGPLEDWMLASGLTHEEIVLVQGIGYEGMGGWNEGLRFELVEDVEAKIVRQTEELRTRLAAAEQQLRAQTDASLDLAVARLQADRAARSASVATAGR